MSSIEMPYLEQFPVPYQFAVFELRIAILESEDVEQHEKLLDEFSAKYTMIPQLWKFYDKLPFFEYNRDTILLSLDHFFIRNYHCYDFVKEKAPAFKKIFNADDRFSSKILAAKNDSPTQKRIILKYLSFPHPYLCIVLKFYEEFCGPTSEVKPLYMKNQQLYGRLKENFKANPLKFFDILMEIDDFERQYVNIELLLSSRPYDIDIWKKYMKFLEEKSGNITNVKSLEIMKMLLKVYRRYCGIFWDDHEIKNKADELDKFIANYAVAAKINFESIVTKFTFDDAVAQEPSLPSTVMNYLFTQANGGEYIKLQMCCKIYLYALQKRVIYRLVIGDVRNKFRQNHLSLQYKHQLFGELRKLWLTCSLDITNMKATRRLIPKIVQCDLKFLRLKDQKLSLKDFTFLVKNGNIELLEMETCSIKDDQNEDVSLEKILEKTPKILKFSWSPCHLTENTFAKLSSFVFQSKILVFNLHDVENLHLDSPSFQTFFEKNLCSTSRILIDLKRKIENFSEADILAFTNTCGYLKQIKAYWFLKDGDIPKFDIGLVE